MLIYQSSINIELINKFNLGSNRCSIVWKMFIVSGGNLAYFLFRSALIVSALITNNIRSKFWLMYNNNSTHYSEKIKIKIKTPKPSRRESGIFSFNLKTWTTKACKKFPWRIPTCAKLFSCLLYLEQFFPLLGFNPCPFLFC